MPDRVFNLIVMFLKTKIFRMKSRFLVYLGKQAAVGSLGACPHLEVNSWDRSVPLL